MIVVDDPRDVGARADAVLARRVPELSRKIVREAARAGRLRIDGVRSAGSTPVALGMRLELDGDPVAPAIDPTPLHVLRTTDAFVFVAKPAGVHSVRVRPSDPSTLADAVAQGFPECADASEDPREHGALHRLDCDTTGVIAFARSRAAWIDGRRAIRSRAQKFYLAISDGTASTWPPEVESTARVAEAPPPELLAALPFASPTPPGIRIDAPLLRYGPSGASVRVDARGDAAVSLVWPLRTMFAAGRAATWLCLRLLTGRQHQARVHLARLGLPVRGDARYGTTSGPMLLHAWALDLGLPEAGPGPVLAPIPDAFLRLA